jgi:hypothetical protein
VQPRMCGSWNRPRRDRLRKDSTQRERTLEAPQAAAFR